MDDNKTRKININKNNNNKNKITKKQIVTKHRKNIKGGASSGTSPTAYDELNNKLLIGHLFYPNLTGDESINTKIKVDDIFDYNETNNTSLKIDGVFEFLLRLMMGTTYTINDIYGMSELAEERKNAILSLKNKINIKNIFKIFDNSLFFTRAIPLIQELIGNKNNNNNKINDKKYNELREIIISLHDGTYYKENVMDNIKVLMKELYSIQSNVSKSIKKTIENLSYFINKYTNSSNDTDKYFLLNNELYYNITREHLNDFISTLFDSNNENNSSVKQEGGGIWNYIIPIATSLIVGVGVKKGHTEWKKYGMKGMFIVWITIILNLITYIDILSINELFQSKIWSKKSMNILRIILEFNSLINTIKIYRSEYLKNKYSVLTESNDINSHGLYEILQYICNNIYKNSSETDKGYFINHYTFDNISSIQGMDINNKDKFNIGDDLLSQILIQLPRDTLLFILNMSYDDTKLIYNLLKNFIIDKNGIIMNLFKVIELNDVINELSLPNILNIKTWHVKYLMKNNKKVCLVKKTKEGEIPKDGSIYIKSMIENIKKKNEKMLNNKNNECDFILLDVDSNGDDEQYEIITEFNPSMNKKYYKMIDDSNVNNVINTLCDELKKININKNNSANKNNTNNNDKNIVYESPDEFVELSNTLIELFKYDDNKIKYIEKKLDMNGKANNTEEISNKKQEMKKEKEDNKKKAIGIMTEVIEQLDDNSSNEQIINLTNIFDSLINNTKYTNIIGNENGKIDNILDNIFKNTNDNNTFKNYEEDLINSIKDNTINEISTLSIFDNPLKAGIYLSIKSLFKIGDDIVKNVDNKINSSKDNNNDSNDTIAEKINKKYLDHLKKNGNKQKYKNKEERIKMIELQLSTAETLKDDEIAGGTKQTINGKKKKYNKANKKTRKRNKR